MRRPRFRFTIGWVMALIAFAGVNLAIYAIVDRNTLPPLRWSMLCLVTVGLAWLYYSLASGFATLRMIRSARRDSTQQGRPSKLIPYVCLVLDGIVVVATLLGLVYFVSVGVRGSLW